MPGMRGGDFGSGGAGNGGDSGEGSVLYVFILLGALAVCGCWCVLCKLNVGGGRRAKAGGTSAGDLQARKARKRAKARQPRTVYVQPKRDRDAELDLYVKRRRVGGGSAMVDTVYGSDAKQYGSGSRARDAGKYFGANSMVKALYVSGALTLTRACCNALRLHPCCCSHTH